RICCAAWPRISSGSVIPTISCAATEGVKKDLTCRMMRVFGTPPPARRSPMAHCTTPRLRFQMFRLQQQPAPQPELGLDGVLPELTVQQILTEEGATWKLIV